MSSMIELSLMRCAVNSRRCVFNDCFEKQGLKRIPTSQRCEVLRTHRIYIPKRSVICQQHLIDFNWHEFINLEFKYTREQIEDMIDLLRKPVESELSALELSKDSFKSETGLSIADFNELFANLPTLHRYFPRDLKRARRALQMYLMRLHKGERYNRICRIFKLSYKTAKAFTTKARIALLTDFVPNNLGFDAISREDIVQSASKMANTLYLDDGDHGEQNKAAIIADGTYVFCNKTQNFAKQKEFYSDHKKRNYFKPMVFVTTNGRFIEVFGPYKAVDNDATILRKIFHTHAQLIEQKLQQGDIFILDRGFQDVYDFLTEKGFTVIQPGCIHKKTLGQLTTQQANVSRMATACRYVVETRNGHMKTIWRLFDRTWITYDLPNAMTDYRIGASLINKFYKTMESNINDAETIAQNMLVKADCRQNEFAVIIDSHKFNKSVKSFTEGDLNMIFPKVTQDDFRLISLGNYQPKIMLSYIYEKIKLDERFIFFSFPRELVTTFFGALTKKYHVNSPAVVLTIFQSRFRSAVKHRTYLFVDQNVKDRKGIILYYCGCQHGRRLVGCCVHILAFIAYLGYYRHHRNEIKGKSTFIDNFFDELQPHPTN